MTGHKPRGTPAPLRLTTADFDALTTERERAQQPLRQRVLAWAQGVVSRLAALGIAVEAEEHPRASVDPGRLRIAFLRDADERAALERALSASVAQQLTSAGALDHVCFALAMDRTRIAVSIELSPLARLDAKNLQARLSRPALARELTRALEALPEQFAVALGGSTLDAQQALRTGADGLARVLERAEDRLTPLWIGWSIPRAVAVTHSLVLDEQLEDAIVALGPIYKLVAWSPDNDLVGLGRTLARTAEDARGPASRGQDSERERALDRRDRLRSKRAARVRPVEEDAAPPQTRDAETPARKREAKRSTRESPSQRTTRGRPILRSTLRTSMHKPARGRLETGFETRLATAKAAKTSRQAVVTDADTPSPLERGTRVRVLTGPFMGKIGVVQEVDGRGGARVMLGLLATRLDVKDLIASAEGRERPSLATSHRKPLPGR